MCYRKEQNARKELLSGVQIEKPRVFINWDIEENVFVEKFVNITKVREGGYFVGNIIFLGQHCNMGIEFKKTVDKISFARFPAIGFHNKHYIPVQTTHLVGVGYFGNDSESRYIAILSNRCS